MPSAPPSTAAPNTARVPDAVMAKIRIHKIEAISDGGMIMVRTMRRHVEAGHPFASGDASRFARIARAIRQTIALEIRLFDGIDPARTRRQLEKLRILSQIGVQSCGQVIQRVDDQRHVRPEDATAFLHVARAARLTIAMEDWVDHDSCLPEEQRLAERARRHAAEHARATAKAERAANADRAGAETDSAGGEGISAYRDETLTEPDIHAELGDRTTAEIIAAACEDLGIACDLSLFAEVQDEDAPSGDAPSGDARSGDARSGDAPAEDATGGDAAGDDVPAARVSAAPASPPVWPGLRNVYMSARAAALASRPRASGHDPP